MTQHIWKVPAYLPYLQPTLTPQAIAEVEETLSIKLPQEFINVLQIQNGGYVRWTFPGLPHSQIWGIGPYYPNITQEQWWQEPDAEEEECWLPDAPKRLIPFDGDGHWCLCWTTEIKIQQSQV